MALAVLRPELKATTSATALLAAEIAARIEGLQNEYNRTTDALREIYLARNAPGARPIPQLTDHDKRVRAKLYERMGQDAPPINAADAEQDLLADRDAITRMLAVLRRDHLAAEVAEAVEYKKVNLPAYNASVRKLLLLSMEVDKISHEIRAMIAKSDGCVRWPFDTIVGERCEISWRGLRADEVWREAVDAKILKMTDITEALLRHDI